MRDTDSPSFFTSSETDTAAKATTSRSLSTVCALARLGARRDSEAWAVLIERHGEGILRIARRATHDPVLSDDICQEALLQIREHAGTFRAQGAPHESELFARGWIMRIACRTALKMIRSRSRTGEREARAESSITATPCPSLTVLRGEEREQIRREVAALPEPHRDAISLRFFADLAYAEIAESLQISEEAAKKRVQRGIDLLRSRLAVSGVAISATLVSSVLQGGAAQAAEAGGAWGAGAAASETLSETGTAAKELLLDETRRAAWQALVNTGQAPALTGVVSGAVAMGGLTMSGKVGAGIAAALIAALGIGGGMELRATRQMANEALNSAKESAAHAKVLEAMVKDSKEETDSLHRLMESRNVELSSLRDKVASLEKVTRDNSSVAARRSVPALPAGELIADVLKEVKVLNADPNQPHENVQKLLEDIVIKHEGNKTTTQRFKVGDAEVMVMTQTDTQPFKAQAQTQAGGGETPEETLKRLKADQKNQFDVKFKFIEAAPEKPEEKAKGDF